MIEFSHVTKEFSGKKVLKDCHFKVDKGEVVGIMGESGSGKTTLAKLLMGLENPSQGTISLNGKPYDIKEDGVRVVMVFQDALQAVNPLFTVRDILTEAGDHVGEDELLILLKDVGLDRTYLEKKADQLSGGQLQRICVARALLLKPEVIIFDEALSGLDPLIQGQLLKLLHNLQVKYQQTILFISHDFNLCYAICHRVLVLFDGEIVDEIKEFTSPMRVSHPATKNLLVESQNPKYSKCQLRKMMIELEDTNRRSNELLYEKNI